MVRGLPRGQRDTQCLWFEAHGHTCAIFLLHGLQPALSAQYVRSPARMPDCPRFASLPASLSGFPVILPLPALPLAPIRSFGDRLFSPPTLGLEVVLFYTAEIGGAFGAGWFLDRPFAAATPRRAAALQLLLFTLLTAVGYAFAASLWRDADGNPRLSFPRDGLRLVAPSLAFFLWGLSDS